MSGGLWRRILLATVLAAGLILVLQAWVQNANSGELGTETVPAPPPSSARVPPHLRRKTVLLYLVGDLARMPEQIAPVVEVLEDGRLATRRAPPVPRGPDEGPWLAAGVVLPRLRLSELTPVQRVAFLSLCDGFSGGDRLEVNQIVGLGFAFGKGELRRLLHWLR